MNSTTLILLSLGAAALLVARFGAADTPPGDAGVGVETAADDSAMPWHELIFEPGRDLRLRRAVADGDGGIWMLFAQHGKGRALSGGGLRLMHIDAAGQRGIRIPVSLPSGLDYRRGCSSIALTLDDARSPAVLCNTNGGIAVIEPAMNPGDLQRIRSFRTDAWPFGLQAAGPGGFRVATNDAVLLWPADSDPEVELAAGDEQVFFAAADYPGGMALLHAKVAQRGPVALKAGRLNPARPSLDGFTMVDDGRPVATLLTKLAADAASLAVLTPVEKGPQSRWHNAVFDADMNLTHSGLLTLPFEVTLTMPLALHVLPDGTQLLASARDGALWLATVEPDGELRAREAPAHLALQDGLARRLMDMQWVASADGQRLLLVSTVILFSEESGGADYGLWLAEIDVRPDAGRPPVKKP